MASCDSCGVPVSEGTRFCPDCEKPGVLPPPLPARASAPKEPMRQAARAWLLRAGAASVMLGFTLRLALPWAEVESGYWLWLIVTGAGLCLGSLLGRLALISSPGWVVVPGLALGLGACALYHVPRTMRSLFRKKFEGSTKGNLGAIRSALSIYYGDLEGSYPETLGSLTVQYKYLGNIPNAVTPPYHRDRAEVRYAREPDDEGGWLYNNDPSDADFGTVTVNCTHTDTRGANWASY